MASQYSFQKQNMDQSIYGRPTLMKFEKGYFYCPQMIELYLKKLYGNDYMIIPDESKRRKPIKVYHI